MSQFPNKSSQPNNRPRNNNRPHRPRHPHHRGNFHRRHRTGLERIFKNPRVIHPFFMALFMAFIMSGVLGIVNLGFVENFFFIWMKTFAIAFFIAFPAAYFVTPFVQKLVRKICD